MTYNISRKKKSLSDSTCVYNLLGPSTQLEDQGIQVSAHTVQLWRACNLTVFIHSSIGPVVHPFASRHEGPGFNPQGVTYVKPGFSC
jgi:hypothetical protein